MDNDTDDTSWPAYLPSDLRTEIVKFTSAQSANNSQFTKPYLICQKSDSFHEAFINSLVETQGGSISLPDEEQILGRQRGSIYPGSWIFSTIRSSYKSLLIRQNIRLNELANRDMGLICNVYVAIKHFHCGFSACSGSLLPLNSLAILFCQFHRGWAIWRYSCSDVVAEVLSSANVSNRVKPDHDT